MNTGETMETDRLWLVPGINGRDNEPFLNMLAKEGDFRSFCGVDYSEKYLKSFENYFERSELEECYYSLFTKENPQEFIGCAGVHRERHHELEVYISKPYRKTGYCTEAANKLIELLFSKGLSVDGHIVTADRIYARTLAENESAAFYGNRIEKYV